MELSERKDNDVTVLEVVGRVDSVTAPDLGEKLTTIPVPVAARCLPIGDLSA